VSCPRITWCISMIQESLGNLLSPLLAMMHRRGKKWNGLETQVKLLLLGKWIIQEGDSTLFSIWGNWRKDHFAQRNSTTWITILKFTMIKPLNYFLLQTKMSQHANITTIMMAMKCKTCMIWTMRPLMAFQVLSH
jgi:hypothetical protein